MNLRAFQIFKNLLLAAILILGSIQTVALAVQPPQPPRSVPPLRTQALQLNSTDTFATRAALQNFLNHFSAIRFFLVDAPGNGHQVANLRTIERLRELGFKGRIQALYDDAVAEKLVYLVPGYDGQKKRQRTNNHQLGQVDWLAKSISKEVIVQDRMPLGIQGASDGAYPAGYRNKLNVDNFLQLQPRLWLQRGSKREIVLATDESISLEHLMGLGAVTQEKISKNWQQSLETNMAGQPELNSKIPFLSELIKSLPHLDLLPAYSVDYPFAPDKMIETVLRGLQQAIQQKPDAFRKAIVIPVFTNFTDSAKQTSFARRLAEMGVPYVDAVNTTPGAANNAIEVMRNAGPRQIIAVQVGGVPNEIFDYIFRQSTLPALVLGKNLSNTMIDAGKPFLNVVGNISSLPTSAQAVDAQRLMLNAFNVLDGRRINQGVEAESRLLAEYILAVRDPQSEISRWLQTWQNDAASLNRDLVGQALLELKSAMESRHLVPASGPASCRQIF